MSDDTAIRKAADRLVDHVYGHEVREHGGEPCASERINMLAYMAHRLGILVPDDMEAGEVFLDLLRERALDYDAAHAEHVVDE